MEMLAVIITILIRVWQVRRRYNVIENVCVVCSIMLQFLAVKYIQAGIHNVDLEIIQTLTKKEIQLRFVNYYFGGILITYFNMVILAFL